MRIMNAKALPRLARKEELTSDFAHVVRSLILDVRDSDRPGAHDVRGPGPK